VTDVATAERRARPEGEPGPARRVRAERGTGYRTFPARLPASLAAAAGALVSVGALGAALRATALTDPREDPRQVAVLMGYRQGAGRLLSILGALLACSALAWLGRRALPKLAAAALALLVAILAARWLGHLDALAARWADAARARPAFLGYHAGLGWGAWLVLLGAIVAGFAVLVGGLRALDLRRGFDG
jgi:hypothetical protein